MNWFWHALWICLVVIPVTVLWVVAIFDLVLARRDYSPWKRFAWLLAVLLLPLFGALAYACVAMGRGAAATDYRAIAPLPTGGLS